MNDVGAVAAAQTIPVPGDVGANIAQHRLLVAAAAPEGIGLLVFPEMSLTGYELTLAADLAFSENDSRLDPLNGLARDHSMTLVVGAPVDVDGQLSIGAFVVTPSGDTALYTKRHLGAGESAFVQPGARDPLIQLAPGSAAIAVCADASHPEHAEAAAARGAHTYVACSFTTPFQMDEKLDMLRRYSSTHSMTVVFANYGGPSGGDPSGGRSTIWSPDGTQRAQLPVEGVGYAVASCAGGVWSGHARAVPSQKD